VHATREDISKPFGLATQLMISGIESITGCDEQNAPWLSPDRLQIWFTCSASGVTPSSPVWYAERGDPSAMFGPPQTFVELSDSGATWPSLTSDELVMYYEPFQSGQIAHATRADKSSPWVVAPTEPALSGHTPSISLDGQTIVFTQDDASDERLMQATGGESAWSTPTQVPVDHVAGANDFSPKLAGDGHTITFASNRSADTNEMFSYCE
jgi:hypothetical protein